MEGGFRLGLSRASVCTKSLHGSHLVLEKGWLAFLRHNCTNVLGYTWYILSFKISLRGDEHT